MVRGQITRDDAKGGLSTEKGLEASLNSAVRAKVPERPPEMPLKQGKTSQHHNWPRYMDWPQIGPKIAIKQGKKPQRTNGTYFARPPPPF